MTWEVKIRVTFGGIMNKLNSNPSKSQEIQFWSEFVGSLPSGYLYSMFAGSESLVAQMIRDDFEYNLLSELRQFRDDLKEEIKGMEKLKANIKQLS